MRVTEPVHTAYVKCGGLGTSIQKATFAVMAINLDCYGCSHSISAEGGFDPDVLARLLKGIMT